MATTDGPTPLVPVIDLREHRLARGLPPGRTLHVIDLENLAGGPGDGTGLAEAAAGYRRAVRVGEADHVVVATNPFIAYDAGLAWPGARLLAAHGRDGADHALVAELEPYWISRHYDRVSIGSGDHAFAAPAWALRAAGVVVIVAARAGHVSRDLRRAACLAIQLPVLAPGKGAVPLGATVARRRGGRETRLLLARDG